MPIFGAGCGAVLRYFTAKRGDFYGCFVSLVTPRFQWRSGKKGVAAKPLKRKTEKNVLCSRHERIVYANEGNAFHIKGYTTMNIEPDEELVEIAVAMKRFLPESSNGKGVGPATYWRWIRIGLCGGIRLRVLFVGAKAFTCRRWVNDFLDRVTAAKLAVKRPQSADSNDVTDDELEAAGLN